MTPPALRCDQAKLPQDVTPLALRCDPHKFCVKIEGFYGSHDGSHGSTGKLFGALSTGLILMVLVNLKRYGSDDTDESYDGSDVFVKLMVLI